MAWVEPKTNWSREDGVRDSDLNRIEGNTLELYNKLSAPAAVTVYINPTGNDTSGDGTYSRPYATFAKALASLPKNLQGAAVTIAAEPGTYNENVSIVGFTGGRLNINCTGTLVVTRIAVEACSYVNIYAYTLTVNGMITADYNSVLFLDGTVNLTTSASYGIRSDAGSRVFLSGTVTVSNKSVAAIYANAAFINLLDVIGRTNTGGFYATRGGIITMRGSSLTATTMYTTESGGRVYAGAQQSAPSY